MQDLQLGWEDYLAVAARRKKVFCFPLVIALLIGGLYSWLSPRVYEASALLVVQNQKLINPLIQGLAMPTEVSDRLESLREEILSWSTLTRLIHEHELDDEIEKTDPVEFEELVKKLRQTIQVRLRARELIQVSYQGKDPSKVQAVVNSLTDIVIERNEEIQEKETSTAVSFIEAELEVYREKLKESEGQLREFKEVYMTQMPVATALNDQLRSLELQLSELLIDNTPEHPRVKEVQRKIQEVRKRRNEEVQKLVAKGVIAEQDPELYDQVLDQLSRPNPVAGSSSNPMVSKAQATFNSLMEGLESPEIAPPSAGSQISISDNGATIQVNDAAAAALTLSPRQQQELANLSRDHTVNESIYRHLLEKLERARITGRLGDDDQGGKFSVIERARYPFRPVKPNILQVFLISLFTGVGLGLGLAMLVEYLDQSCQSIDDVVELLDIPALGTISAIVTEEDLEERRRRQKNMLSPWNHVRRLKNSVLGGLWARVDKILVRWGL